MRSLAEHGALSVHEPVHSVMSTHVHTCRAADRADELMARMTEKRVRHLPVVDSENHLCGIVSIGDVVKTRVTELEAEHDQLVEYVRAGQ